MAALHCHVPLPCMLGRKRNEALDAGTAMCSLELSMLSLLGC